MHHWRSMLVVVMAVAVGAVLVALPGPRFGSPKAPRRAKPPPLPGTTSVSQRIADQYLGHSEAFDRPLGQRAAAPLAAFAGADRRPEAVPAARLPAGFRFGAPLAPSQKVRLAVVLRSRDAAGLAGFLAAVYDPKNPAFHHFVTPSRFGEAFGATNSAIGAVEAYLTNQGMTAGPIAPDHLYLPLSGSAAAVEAAFHTRLKTVYSAAAGSAGAGWYANSSPAKLPAGVAGDVVAVVGLENVNAMRPNLSAAGAISPPVLAVPSPAAVAGGANCPVLHGSPVPALAAYGASPLYRKGVNGSGTTIGLIELSGYRPSDVVAFENACGLHNQVIQAGSAGGGGLEATADIEAAAAVAPGARIAVYAGPSSWSLWSQAINADVAQVVSSSWTTCEPFVPASVVKAESVLFAQAAAQGQTVLAASGDWGRAGCGYGGLASAAVEDPASQPLVTAVGGTSLVLGVGAGSKPVAAQAAWPSSGGGYSGNWLRPPWQAKVSGAASGKSPGPREVPDVSASANPAGASYYVYCSKSCGNGWSRVGGTSMSTPLWAGLVSLADQSCAARVGMLGPALYSKAAAGDLQAVAASSAGRAVGASKRYNIATGLGTPDIAALAPSLCAPASSRLHG